jgi:hypothetical protein
MTLEVDGTYKAIFEPQWSPLGKSGMITMAVARVYTVDTPQWSPLGMSGTARTSIRWAMRWS